MSIPRSLRPRYAKYTHHYRHTSAQSERFTGGDSLVSALRSGWEVCDLPREEVIGRGAGRHIVVYYFTLQMKEETRTLAVVSTPYVQRMAQYYRSLLAVSG